MLTYDQISVTILSKILREVYCFGVYLYTFVMFCVSTK